MKSTKLLLIASALFVSAIAMTSQSQARQIYWTGRANVTQDNYNNAGVECQEAAYWRGDAGARQSCIRDFRIQPSVCNSAPVVNTEYSPLNWNYNQVACSVRVYIQVP